MLIAGQLFHDRYMILREVAEGGQATVYMAQDKGAFDRVVAIKEFKLNSVALNELPNAIKQFGQTASLLAHLNHPNIAQIFEYITLGNVPYLVTEFIMGGTLEQFLRSNPNGLPEVQVIQWGMQLCDVLKYLHGQMPPIIFRDLKPDNIMLAPNGQIKLIDFGIARTFKAGRAGDTELLGTPGFAPPEQYGQGASQTGPYTDVYALGVTLMRLATGFDPSQTPFQIPRADKLNPAISRTFADALAAATVVDFRKRLQTIQAFQDSMQGRKPKTVAKTTVLPNNAQGTQNYAQIPASRPRLSPITGVISLILLLVLAGVALGATGVLSSMIPAAVAPTAPASVSATPAAATAVVAKAVTPTPADAVDVATVSPKGQTATAVAERTRIASDIWKTATAIALATKISAADAAEPTSTAEVASAATEIPATVTPAGVAPAKATSTPAPQNVATLAPTTTSAAGTSNPSGKAANAMFSFERAFAWRRGDQAYADMTYSTEQAHDGSGSAKIAYNFPSVADDFVVFINRTALPANATGMAVWVYGDGSGSFLNTWIEDSAGQVRQFSFGRIYFQGWQQMVAWFNTASPWPQSHISGPDSTVLQAPVNFYAVVLDRQGGPNTGAVYLDEMNYVTQPIPVGTAAAASATPAATAIGATAEAPTAAPPASVNPCSGNIGGVSNLCVGSNPVANGSSTYAIWRIEGTFKEGCFNKGDGSGCVGPITAQMRADLGVLTSSRTVIVSWTDASNKRYSDSVYILVQ